MKKFSDVCTDEELVEYNTQLEEEGHQLIGKEITSRMDVVLTALMVRVRKLEERINEN